MADSDQQDNSPLIMQLELLPLSKKRDKTQGKLIVIEGSDGAGKATQLDLLKKYLIKQKIPVKVVDFPQYKTSFYGKMIAAYLRGEFGKFEHIHPYLISVVYAMDRVSAKRKMDSWLKGGNIILSNRYATSNMAHQSARLIGEEKENFLTWIEELEYKLNKIPREDIVLYLYVPYQISQELILQKSKDQRLYAKGKTKDLAEENLDHMRRAQESYLDLVKRFSHWVKINCVDELGKLKPKEMIHREILEVLKTRNMV